MMIGEQAKPMTASSTDAVKMEPVYVAQDTEEAYANFWKKGQHRRSNLPSYVGRSGNSYGGNNRGMHRRNPKDKDGNVCTCNICQSTMHFSMNCPHSYENMKKQDAVEAIMFTGQQSDELCVVG